MAIITISRGSFSGGVVLAECLSNRLGCRSIDRDAIIRRAAESGVSEEELQDALLKPPGFLEGFSHKRYRYLAVLQAALAEEVRTGYAVYHGNAGHLLLGGGGPVLRTRVIAPLDFRIAMAMARLKCSRNEALAYIHRVDPQRRKWVQYLYGIDWVDPSHYDLVINLEHVGIDQACRIIGNMARQRSFELTPDHLAWLENLLAASRLKARLALEPATVHLEFEATADRGRVTLRGRQIKPEELEAIRAIARAVPGVAGLDLSQLVAGS